MSDAGNNRDAADYNEPEAVNDSNAAGYNEPDAHNDSNSVSNGELFRTTLTALVIHILLKI